MVKGQFTLTRYNLRDRDPALHTTDASIVAGLRDLYATLRKGSVGARAIVREAASAAARRGRWSSGPGLKAAAEFDRVGSRP